MRLEKLTLSDLREETYHFLLPLGSTEQHGPFAPFGTDTFILDDVLRRVEKEISELVVLPTLPYSCSSEHEGFKGSVWLSEATLSNLIEEIRTSLIKNTKSFSLLSWHGGNEAALKNYVREISSSTKGINLLDFYDAQIEVETKQLINGPIDEHAGNTEISMVLAIDDILAKLPASDYKKTQIKGDPFAKEKLIDSTKDGIADNHPEWVIDQSIGEKLLEMYAKKILKDLRKVLSPSH